MLGIVGLLGAMVAGIVGDALMSLAHKDDDADATPPDAEPAAAGDLLDDDPDAGPLPPPFPEDGSDAGPDPTDEATPAEDDGPAMTADDTAPMIYLGDGTDEFIMGSPDADVIIGAAGDDTLDGGDEGDILFGGMGDDDLTGAGDDATDALYGGAGDDVLTAGAGDTAWGGAGIDSFTLSDYTPGDPPAVIADYAPGQDRIVLMYDADLHPEPIVQTEAIEGTEDVAVLLDGLQVAIVQGAAGLDWEDIHLMAA